VGHAYIFEGENFAATRSFALGFAKGLNCLNSGDSSAPCGECPSCNTFDSGNNPDFVYVTGTKQKGIGVDDVRAQILMPMAYKPYKYKYKIFITNQAETLTPAAQNALLKTIEEPAPYGVFLFIATHSHNFLPTMLSRCVLKKIQGDSSTQAVTPELQVLAQDINNRVGDSDIYETFALYRLFEPLNKNDVGQLLDLLYKIYGEKITHAAKAGQEPEKIWFNSAAAITKTKRILSQNGNVQLAIELMLNEMRKPH